MKTATPPDYLALKVFCQMSLEEAGIDREAGTIFGRLYNLVDAAEKRTGMKADALDAWLSPAEIEKTKAELDDSAPGEILLIATMLRVMAESTEEHANDLRADERQLTAEDADARAGRYRAAYDAILHVFND